MINGHEIMMGRTANEVVANLPTRVSHRVWQWINETPAAIALQEAARSWTYADLGLAVNDAQQHLIDHQVRGGDRLILVCENACVLAAFVLAASDLDAWVVPVNARMSGAELDAILDDCQPRHVIYTVEASSTARKHAERHNASFAQHPRWGEFAFSGTLDSSPEPVCQSGQDQVFAMIYTSGTTGKPKGVMLTHNNVAFVAALSAANRGLGADSRVYVVLPMSHSFGLTAACMATLLEGAMAYLEPSFNPETCLNTLLEQQITMLMGVPPMYSALIEAIKTRGLQPSNLSLSYLSVGGAPLDPETKNSTESFFGLSLHNGFGLTETSPTIAQVRFNEGLDNCSCGRPMPGVEVRLVKDDGGVAATGEIGELWTRGPHVMKGYFRKPELTDNVLNAEGWFNTEDLALQDAAGNLTIAGRTKELIVRSGFNVYPAEIEAVLNAHPLITQSAVVGISHQGDEDVLAYVQTMPGAAITEEDLNAYCKEKLTGYKRPSKITLMDALPASNTGKLLKARLKEMATLSLQKA
ncbi:MAG: AMP-binding protein [Motiliproteus sp.]